MGLGERERGKMGEWSVTERVCRLKSRDRDRERETQYLDIERFMLAGFLCSYDETAEPEMQIE